MTDISFATQHPTEHYDVIVRLDGEHSRLCAVVDDQGEDVALTPNEQAFLLQEALQYAADVA